ncbi:lipocalin family protein [Bergeyella porcorum]|uniref:lipocalin family protein n=1 Tax=Bergeyella porcorum TaxID=1735111 RepID=UPI0035EE6898
MKKLILFSMATLSLTACKRDDDNTTAEPSIVGTWNSSKYVIYSGKDKSILKEEPATACDAKDTMIFTSDKKVSDTYYTESNGTCVENGTDAGTYSYDATTKKLIFHWSGNTTPGTVDVLKLTEKEFEFVDEDFDYNNDGVDDIHTAIYTRVK